jgi:hypothetical protein
MRRYLLDTGIMGDLMSRRLGALGNCMVVTKEGDLSAVLGLQVENWATA